MSSDAELLRELSMALDAGQLDRWAEITRQMVPLHDLMQLSLVETGDRTVLTMELNDRVRGSAVGTVHGGLLATLADVASAQALSGAFEMGSEVPVTTDLHVRYYRQPREGPVTATAEVVHRGRRLLGTECVVTDGEGRVLARSTATYMVVPYG